MANIIKADLDEMVFDGREKKYGAYLLRKRYPKTLAIAVAISMSCFTLVALGNEIANALGWEAETEEKTITTEVTIALADLPPPPPLVEDMPPPPPPVLPPPPKVKTVSFRIPEPTPESDLPDEKEEIKTVEELNEIKDAVIGVSDQDGLDASETEFELIQESGEGDVPIVVQETEPSSNAFIVADEQPRPVNMGTVKQAIGYPQSAADAEIEGNVVVRVLVDKKGHYRKHVVINGVHPILEKAVAKNLSKLQFTPAVQGGKPIMFWVNIPFSFKLMK